MVGFLGDEGPEILVDALTVVNFGEDTAAFGMELGGPMDDAPRFGSVEGEACTDVVRRISMPRWERETQIPTGVRVKTRLL